ncbi:ABC transporter permease [Thalassospiraceae bacterium LMO-SO8]|nr:ABC transporter permease [Alphaproteobacteria bacterium LMO-S08]WND75268.1 ABC transporter permease [Thalassospiraceae bacterium LMO-SO8]
MVTVSEIQTEAQFEEVAPKKPWSQVMLELCRKQPLGVFGLAIVFVMIAAAILAEVVAPNDPLQEHFDAMLAAPSAEYLLGTDEFGRDILTRLIYGSRTALLVGFVCAIVGATGGLVLGVASAYFGGLFDLILQRILDVFMAFPLIILALAVVATLGPGIENVMIAIILPFVPQCARVVRSNALAIREIPYVDAARALGFSDARIILRHMVPNVMAPYLIMLTTFLGQAILLEASLSFLGLGVQDPTPAWGLMLSNASEFFEGAPWVAVYPGIAISLSVFGFNLFGDSVRDVLDPKMRSR